MNYFVDKLQSAMQGGADISHISIAHGLGGLSSYALVLENTETLMDHSKISKAIKNQQTTSIGARNLIEVECTVAHMLDNGQ